MNIPQGEKRAQSTGRKVRKFDITVTDNKINKKCSYQTSQFNILIKATITRISIMTAVQIRILMILFKIIANFWIFRL